MKKDDYTFLFVCCFVCLLFFDKVKSLVDAFLFQISSPLTLHELL